MGSISQIQGLMVVDPICGNARDHAKNIEECPAIRAIGSGITHASVAEKTKSRMELKNEI